MGTEFILAIAMIGVFCFWLMDIDSEQYLENINDSRLTKGTKIKITSNRQRLHDLFRTNNMKTNAIIDIDQFLGKGGTIKEINQRKNTILIDLDNGCLACVPIKACII